MSISTDGVGYGEPRSRSSPLPMEEIEAALEAVKNQVENAEKQIAVLEETLLRARKEQHLLEGLIALRRREEPADGYSESDTGSNTFSLASETVFSEQAHDDVADAAVLVLRDHGEPMRIGELMTVLKDQNVRLPGQGTQANLISRISRDERIIRTSRGVYALREWGLEEIPRSKRGGRRKRKNTKSRT
jgi:hypothetical protein